MKYNLEHFTNPIKALLEWHRLVRPGGIIEDILISVMQVGIVAAIIGIVALVGVDAWMQEDIARVEKLKKHFYDVAFSRATVGPAAPTGVRPNYGDLSEPKTRVFQDAGQAVTSGMGFDARKKERGR